MVQYRDSSFLAYHWHLVDIDEASGLQSDVCELAYGSTLEGRRAAFLKLLGSNNPAAMGIALDQYSYNQTLRRWGIDNELQPYEENIAEAARTLLHQPPVTALEWNESRAIVGANHASALNVLGFIGTETDCVLIEPILHVSTDPEVLNNAYWALDTCLQKSQTVYPNILQSLRRLLFESEGEFSETEQLRLQKSAIRILSEYKLSESETILLDALKHGNYQVSVEAALILMHWNLPQYCEQIQAAVSSWPADAVYRVNEVKYKLDEYLNPPASEPELSEEEKHQIEKQRRRDNIERINQRELEWYYPQGFTLYFWNSLRDIFIPNRDMGRLVSFVFRVLIAFDGEERIDEMFRLLKSDFIPAKCAAFEIFACHQVLGRYDISNPFVPYSDEVLAQARLQLKQAPVASHDAHQTSGANHASALLALKYLGDSSDLPTIEAIIKASQDINTLFQGWQAIRHCSGQYDVLHPQLLTLGEKILQSIAVNIVKRDVLNLFYEYKVDGVETILVRAAHIDNSYSLTPELQAEAAFILLLWDLPKYIEDVRARVFHSARSSNLRSFALSESYRMIQEYDQQQAGKTVDISSVS
jgi:hypothetical protein